MIDFPGKKKGQGPDRTKELKEILAQVKAAKGNLAELALSMDEQDGDTGGLDEALDALDDVVDILEEVLEAEQ